MSEPETETPPEPDTPETPDEARQETPAPDENGNPDAEPAEPIEGPEEPTEPPQEPASEAPAMDEKAIEKAHRETERLRKDVAGRVGRIFGEDVVHMVECPLCSETAPGWIWNPQQVELQEDHMARVLLALGVVGPKKLHHHPFLEACPMCGGEGQLETGSKIPGMNVIDCERCGKKGWVDTRQNAPTITVHNGAQSEPVLTGPLHYQEPARQDQYDDDPAVQSLKERGFLVVPPPDMGVRVN